MDYETTNGNEFESVGPRRGSRLPLVLGLGGVAFGALMFGFLVASAVGGSGGGGSADQAAPSPTEQAMATPGNPGNPGTPPPAKTEDPATPPPAVSTPGAPTATPQAPTVTPTIPAINSPKFHDIFRAEGGSVSKNATTTLPVRRLEANWNNSYKNCPSATCIRGRASVLTAVGPFGTGESPVASASVYNTFVAQRANANLLMDVHWKGSLAAIVGANVNTGVEIEIVVSEIDPKTNKVVKALPNMPFSVLSKELGLEAIQGLDTLKLEDSRSVNIPLKLEPGHLYRIDLKITCSTRAAFSLSATICSFHSDDGFAGVEWTKQVIEYDTGICSPTQKGAGCIYQD